LQRAKGHDLWSLAFVANTLCTNPCRHELWSSSLGGGADLYLIQAGGTLNAELNTSWRLPDEFA
jgi:hypothetical protein